MARYWIYISLQKREYLPFKEARNYVRKLGLKNNVEWTAFCKSGKKPQNIPMAANDVYKEEWKGLGDWLGTGKVATRNIQYRPFNEARAFVRKLKLKNQHDWDEYCKSGNKPKDILQKAYRTYSHANPNDPAIFQWKNALQSAINGMDKCFTIQEAISCQSLIPTIISNCKSHPNTLLACNDTRFAQYPSILKQAQEAQKRAENPSRKCSLLLDFRLQLRYAHIELLRILPVVKFINQSPLFSSSDSPSVIFLSQHL